MIQEIIIFVLRGTAFYFISINIAYGILITLSWMEIKRYRRWVKSIKNPNPSPPVSFIVPAFNEESLIVETIQTYLCLTEIQKEIIVINDGSHDKTFKLLQTMYQLKLKEGHENKEYISIANPNLRVLELPHAGKAHALNMGIQIAQYDLICTMDADTVPEARGVNACLHAFANDPKLVAAGGVIQVLDSKILKNNAPTLHAKKSWLKTFQKIEYLRAFVCERTGWSLLNSTILVSGAFCMIRKEAVNRVGGFRTESITEDFDIIVRLRREYVSEKFHFKTLPVTTCYTQAPRTLKHLKKQRVRWQLGLVQTLCRNLSLFFHPAYGPLGLLAIPYFWMVEVFSPVIEVLAFIIISYAMFYEIVSAQVVATFLFIGLAFNVAITLIGIYLDTKYVSEKKIWSYFGSTIDTVLLHFGYKQFNSWWRLLALFKIANSKSSWGDKPREEIIHQSSERRADDFPIS